MEGAGRIGTFLTLILRIPGLGRAHALGDALMYWLLDPKSPSVLGPMDRDDVWFWGAQTAPDAMPDAAATRARVAQTLGGKFDFEVLATDSWPALRLIAASYGAGRVYLAGDACHLHSPFGGYGMNLGIADAVDLGWKISALLEGWGGAGLLASYEAERRPVHQRIIEEASENMTLLSQHFLNPHLDEDGERGVAAREAAGAAIRAAKDREFHSLGLVIGYDYAGSPLIVPDGSPQPPGTVTDYAPSARPGRRAPHAWFADRSSLFDRFGSGFTLLQFSAGGGEETAPLLAAARAAGVPLVVVTLPSAELRALYGARLALIRPDQHVAWRGDGVTDASAVVDTVRGAHAETGTTLR